MPAVGVCGFPRSGSSMTMRMLHAGGIEPVDGSQERSYELGWADFENILALGPTELAGRAVKLLDSYLWVDSINPSVTWKFIWLDRDHRQQAKSTVKWLSLFTPGVGRPSASRLVRSFEADRPRALSLLGDRGEVLMLRYRDTLADPLGAARRIGEFLAPELEFDPLPAHVVVHDRDERCRPDIAVELGADVTPLLSGGES